MSAPDNFLSRWSRRKLEADKPEEDKLAPAEAPAAPIETDRLAEGGAPAIVEPVPEAGLSEEEIAALPRLEELTAATDLAPFMRQGVPALLRNAALRRMWSLDPAIRDFVGEARDYSYDWNVPGGVPVSGPLMPGDDVEATLSRMFSRLSSDEPSQDEVASSGDAERPAGFKLDAENADLALGPPDGEGSDAPAAEPTRASDHPQQMEPALVMQTPKTDRSEPSTERGAGRKRHGAARPKLDLF